MRSRKEGRGKLIQESVMALSRDINRSAVVAAGEKKNGEGDKEKVEMLGDGLVGPGEAG